MTVDAPVLEPAGVEGPRKGEGRTPWLWWLGAAAGVAALWVCAVFLVWKRGTPYQDKEYSPDGLYYIQKYAVISPGQFVAIGPGQGSDSIDGYIRLYDRSGRLLKERFATFIRDIRPVWDPPRVYLMGIPEMDDDPWILPPVP